MENFMNDEFVREFECSKQNSKSNGTNTSISDKEREQEVKSLLADELAQKSSIAISYGIVYDKRMKLIYDIGFATYKGNDYVFTTDGREYRSIRSCCESLEMLDIKCTTLSRRLLDVDKSIDRLKSELNSIAFGRWHI